MQNSDVFLNFTTLFFTDKKYKCSIKTDSTPWHSSVLNRGCQTVAAPLLFSGLSIKGVVCFGVV